VAVEVGGEEGEETEVEEGVGELSVQVVILDSGTCIKHYKTDNLVTLSSATTI
jgi:hypothetical protein